MEKEVVFIFKSYQTHSRQAAATSKRSFVMETLERSVRLR